MNNTNDKKVAAIFSFLAIFISLLAIFLIAFNSSTKVPSALETYTVNEKKKENVIYTPPMVNSLDEINLNKSGLYKISKEDIIYSISIQYPAPNGGKYSIQSASYNLSNFKEIDNINQINLNDQTEYAMYKYSPGDQIARIYVTRLKNK